MADGIVAPNRARTKREVSDALGEAWFRVSKGGKKGRLADACDVRSTKTIDAAIAGRSVPEFHTVLNSLLADPTALAEVFDLYGFNLVPRHMTAANDLQVIAEMNGASAAWLKLLIDGIRCKRDSKNLAEIFRPLICEMQAVVAEADAA